MKKILLIAVLAAATVCASAKVHFGVGLGYDYVTITEKDNWFGSSLSDYTSGISDEPYREVGTVAMNGFHVGPTLSFDIKKVKGLGISTGVLYQFAAKKNSDRKYYVTNYDYVSRKTTYYTCSGVSDHTYLHNLQVPIRVNYCYNFNKFIGLFAFAGPEINLGIFYGRHIKATYAGGDYEKQYNYFNGEGYYKIAGDKNEKGVTTTHNMFDIMFGVGTGVRLGKFYVSIGYDFGLLNRINKDYQFGYKSHQNQFQLSTGFSL